VFWPARRKEKIITSSSGGERTSGRGFESYLHLHLLRGGKVSSPVGTSREGPRRGRKYELRHIFKGASLRYRPREKSLSAPRSLKKGGRTWKNEEGRLKTRGRLMCCPEGKRSPQVLPACGKKKRGKERKAATNVKRWSSCPLANFPAMKKRRSVSRSESIHERTGRMAAAAGGKQLIGLQSPAPIRAARGEKKVPVRPAAGFPGGKKRNYQKTNNVEEGKVARCA